VPLRSKMRSLRVSSGLGERFGGRRREFEVGGRRTTMATARSNRLNAEMPREGSGDDEGGFMEDCGLGENDDERRWRGP
jgi:hypothetical protein